MNLTQLKQDRERGMLLSPCTWDALLDWAIELERKLDEVYLTGKPHPGACWRSPADQKAVATS